MHQAIYNIILRCDTHIDSLLERLKEERVRRVIEQVIIGELTKKGMIADNQYFFVTFSKYMRQRDRVFKKIKCFTN